ncbi:MAG TPA: hypothetical protein VKH44_01215, partial [Pirellulaceae bacterium]|nr:hypothetical protein [Pirellulaceae bacterium]
MEKRSAASRLTIAVIILLLLIGISIWTWHSFLRPPRLTEVSRDVIGDSSLPNGRTPVAIRGAVLYDCYEHYRENVPPRNDTKARANHWQPPPMPAEIIRIASAEKLSPGDTQLLEYLKNWESGYRSGRHLLAPDWQRLAELVQNSNLHFQTLFDLGVAAGFLENISVAAIFHRAALRQAEREYKNLSPLHPAAPMLRVALPQMGMFWSLGDYPLVEQRFRLEMQLYPPLSQEARKCAHSCAEAMYYQGRPKEPADLIADVMQRHEQAGDLNASDKQEMGWIVGIFYGPDRTRQAIAGLAVAARSGGNRANSALQVIASKIASLPPDQAEIELDGLSKYKLLPQEILKIQAYVDERKAIMTQRQATTRPTTRAAMTSQQMALLAERAAAQRAALASSRPT